MARWLNVTHQEDNLWVCEVFRVFYGDIGHIQTIITAISIQILEKSCVNLDRNYTNGREELIWPQKPRTIEVLLYIRRF